MDNRTLHPRRGPHNPLRTPSTRLPGSVRRTATLDTLRPEGLTGPLHLRGAARDLVTDADGNGTVSGRAALTAEVDFMGGRTMTALRSDPDESRLRGLVGTQTWRGFRSTLADVVPDHVRSASLLHLMLDDVPVAALVSGHAMISAGVRPSPAGHRYRPTSDLCSGWRTGGTIMVEIDRSGFPPNVVGPQAPSLLSASDALAWHDLPGLPPHSMRRSRCLDLQRDGSDLLLESHFRDSHVDADGFEEVVHEYRVSVWVDSVTLTVLEVATTAHVLPFVECPPATGSGDRLVGVPVAELRAHVRQNLKGIGTCTHLNDQYRSLADLPALLSQLPE
ncbi:DUF2889 domain-containing protein [Microtetraspora sp. AC03309]|uniref:DUF2889 domain-containing protein n=1 Tax=Microtetraspora sp. AC03309 TaxID=2779376 RepID=UPI001E5A74A2|nr:DUF2889 domain-containing protein [Microtetraspora sp. AC03309]MCC5575218.1 DUF2889 domain-containing protein [Microtetraspora sp. AC03309]